MTRIEQKDLKEDEIYGYIHRLQGVTSIGFLKLAQKHPMDGAFIFTDITPYLRSYARIDSTINIFKHPPDSTFTGGDSRSDEVDIEIFSIDVDELNKHVIMEHI